MNPRHRGADTRPALRPFLSAALLSTLLTNCGYPGPVLAPLLDIPMPVPYVNAIEYGDKIIVEFTLPDLTTEGNPLRNVRLLEVRVGVGPSPFTTEGCLVHSPRKFQPRSGLTRTS
jgi:hypothetical protein